MQLQGHTVLVTGGASGIGRALADRFHRSGSQVIACGRRSDRLDNLRAALPGTITRVCDLREAPARAALIDWVAREHPQFDVLVNNAGIQRYPSLTEPEDWARTQEEIRVNLDAPIHLAMLAAPHLSRRPHAAIINLTSGLSFAPLARAPIYSATKAALHSFTWSLRHHLAGTSVQVIELIPPAVDTDLGGPGLHTFGVPVDEFADVAMAGFARGDLEIAHGFAAGASQASRAEIDALFARMNGSHQP